MPESQLATSETVSAPEPPTRSVALVTLGCARNEVDSEELAGRLAAAGWLLVDDAAEADVAVVNTCGFIEQAKKDSIDVLLDAAAVRDDRDSRTQAVVAVGCLAERYGKDLAEQLPEADAVLGFDSYTGLAAELESILAGHRPVAHSPRDRRTVLPLAPADRSAHRPSSGTTESSALDAAAPSDGEIASIGKGPASGPRVVRARLDGRPWAPLKLASGCDRRCAFCAIPAFRGAFVSRPPAEVLAEAAWLAEHDVREIFLVSENSTSYGKDLGDLRLLDALLPQLAAVEGIDRVRVSYLQPAELRPSLLDVIADTEGVAPYFDLSFQHAAPALLRRMRRFGSSEDFLTLIERIRSVSPQAGIRSNVILGFPGETEQDVAELASFLQAARLDVVGVFGFSPEDGTEAADLEGQLDPDEVEDRVRQISDLVEDLMAQRAEDRIGEEIRVLVEEEDEGELVGRAAHQGPEVDGVTRLVGPDGDPVTAASRPTAPFAADLRVGGLVTAKVWGSQGVDLLAEPVRS